jgi:hypothetical protein
LPSAFGAFLAAAARRAWTLMGVMQTWLLLGSDRPEHRAAGASGKLLGWRYRQNMLGTP